MLLSFNECSISALPQTKDTRPLGGQELFLSFVNEHLDEPEEMVSFPPSNFGLRFWLYCSNIL